MLAFTKAQALFSVKTRQQRLQIFPPTWPTHPVSLQVLLTLCESVAMIAHPETNTMIDSF